MARKTIDAKADSETKRETDLSDRKALRERLIEVWESVDKGYRDQNERTNANLDHWDIFNCKTSDKQCYSGNSQVYVPIVHDALIARSTRFTNQLFPQNGRLVEAVTENGDIPSATVSLLEHYIRQNHLRTRIVPPMIRSGDIEGQYSLYVSWETWDMTAVRKTKEKPSVEIEEDIGGLPIEGMDIEADAEPVESRGEMPLHSACPWFELIPDADLMVLPVTAESIADAMRKGGSVTLIRRWTEDEIDFAERQGWITTASAESLIGALSDASAGKTGSRDIIQQHLDAAGIQEGGEIAIVYETWTMLEVDGKSQLCRAFYGGDNLVLGCKLSPYWKPLPPIISAAVEKAPGVFKGRSKIETVAPMQYAANDIINEGMDSATYAMLPIIMTDPEKNPRVNSMVLDIAAVWETSPNDTQFAEFPPLYQHALQLVGAIKSEIFQTLSVNSAMIPQQTGVKTNRKLNQAEIAQEQQVDILSTSEAVANIEQSVLNEALDWMLWLDHQFRDDDITIPAFGQMGIQATMEKIEPIQMDHRYFFRWFGVEAARNVQQIQQQIAAVNVIRGIPPQLYEGRKLDLVPFIENLAENAFGPRLGPLVFKDMSQMLTVEVGLENKLLLQGFDLETHPLDDDNAHMAAHGEALGAGDPHGTIRIHMQKHQQQMQQKMMAMAQQAMQAQMAGGGLMGGPPGGPGAGVQGAPGGAGPGMAGTPRIGAQPTGARPTLYNPPGAMHQDQMPAGGAVGMPRKMG